MSDTEFIEAARQARTKAHSPYSNFAVGAVLVTKSGRAFAGCNVENISFGLTMCAERVAIGAAISEGQKDFDTIYLVADSRRPVLPCGACRQVLAEFSSDLKIVSATLHGEHEVVRLSDLLPRPKQGILESFQDV